jgi:hypothetical protein
VQKDDGEYDAARPCVSVYVYMGANESIAGQEHVLKAITNRIRLDQVRNEPGRPDSGGHLHCNCVLEMRPVYGVFA